MIYYKLNSKLALHISNSSQLAPYNKINLMKLLNVSFLVTLLLNCTFYTWMNNHMNFFIKILSPRKFQQTDCVQLATPVQLQHEDLLQ